MKIYNNLDIKKKNKNSIVAIGNFDGINLGNKKEDLPSEEDEQFSDEEIQEFIRQIKMYQKLMEYCSKNPKECE